MTIEQPCRCTRPLTFLIAFTRPGTVDTRERRFKLQMPGGISTTSLRMSLDELGLLGVTPGRYAITFALYDEHDHAVGDRLSGNPFSYGTDKSTLRKRPGVPPVIGRDQSLDVPFEFDNDGDTTAAVTALLVFTRPGSTRGIEYYLRDLLVAPGGATHVVSVPARMRRELGVGGGTWLVTAAAFDAAGERIASFPGNLLMIGKVDISMPTPPMMTPMVGPKDDFTVKLTVDNRGDTEDEFTAVLVFSSSDVDKPIEYQVSGIRIGPGASKHSLVLTPKDRAALGLGKGIWKVTVSGLDPTGRRLETHRGNNLIVR